MTTTLPQHSAAASLVATPPRWRLGLQRSFPQDANTVWAAITEPDRIAQWAPFRPDRNIATEGPVRLHSIDGSDAPYDSIVLETTPHESLSYFWGTNQLRFMLTSDDDASGNGGTTLTLVQIFDDHNLAASMAAGWHLCLGALELSLAGKEAPSVVGDNAKQHGWDDLERQYRALFDEQTDASVPGDETDEDE